MEIVQDLPLLIPRLCERVFGDGSNQNNRRLLTAYMDALRSHYNSDTSDEDPYTTRSQLRAAYIYIYMLYGIAAFRYRILHLQTVLRDMHR